MRCPRNPDCQDSRNLGGTQWKGDGCLHRNWRVGTGVLVYWKCIISYQYHVWHLADPGKARGCAAQKHSVIKVVDGLILPSGGVASDRVCYHRGSPSSFLYLPHIVRILIRQRRGKWGQENVHALFNMDRGQSGRSRTGTLSGQSWLVTGELTSHHSGG